MKALGLIIQREYTSRVKTKAFILTTLFTPLLFLAISILPAYLASINEAKIKKVFVIDNTGKYAKMFESSENYQFIDITNAPTTEKMDALLQIDADLNINPKAVTFYSEQQQAPRDLTRYINDVLSDAVKNKKIEDFTTASNIEPQIVNNLQEILKSKDRISINIKRWDETGKANDTLGEVASYAGMGLTFFMFFFIMMYGSIVMQSVVEEKTNRIVEVIISSVKPFDLMMGKIIGVALVGITQLIAWFGVGIITFVAFFIFFGGQAPEISSPDMQQAMVIMQDNPDFMSSAVSGLLSINWTQIIICFIVYFIGGYLLYASIFAMFGSAANDSQEAQQMMMPATILLMVAFYAGFAAARNPEGDVAFWCSLIPFTSPIAMMVRTPFEIPFWQLATSIVLLYATSILTVRVAGKIYRTGILMYGKKVTFKEIFKWLSYK